MFKQITKGALAATFVAMAMPSFADTNTPKEDTAKSCPAEKTVKELTEKEKKICLGEDKDKEKDKGFFVRIDGSIDSKMASDVIEDLRKLNNKDPDRPITIYINSYGGSVIHGFAIYDTMNDISNPIRTICEGANMSMALVLLSAGTPGMREALPNCYLMAHQTSGGTMGNIEDNRLSMEYSNSLNQRLIDILAQHSGWDVDTLTDIMSNNVYLTAEQGKEMGFIDNIIDPAPQKKPPQTPRKTAKDLPKWFCDGERGNIMRICR